MKKKYIQIISVILLQTFVGIKAYGQATVKDNRVEHLLTKAQQFYEQTPEYVLDMTYTLYQGKEGTTPLSTYTGHLVKDGLDYYSKINNTETFKLGREYLKVNHDQKKGYYTTSTVEGPENPTINVSSFLIYFKHKAYAETSTHYICTLSTTGVTTLPYGRAEVYIDKTSGRITKQILHYLSKQKFTDAQGNIVWDYPRLQIDFTGFEKNINPYLSKFDLDKYIHVTSKKIEPKGSLSGYAIAQ